MSVHSLSQVVIKLIWDEETPPFLPTNAVLHTIVWTLVCALDGVMWPLSLSRYKGS